MSEKRKKAHFKISKQKYQLDTGKLWWWQQNGQVFFVLGLVFLTENADNDRNQDQRNSK